MAKQIINETERLINWSGGREGQNTFAKGQMDFYGETKAKNRNDYPS